MKSSNGMIIRLLDSEVKGQLLVLFHKNPGLIDTVEGIARRIGRTAPAIENDIKDLAQFELVRLTKYDDVTAVSFNHEKDREIQDAILEHLKSLSEQRKGGKTE